MDKLSLQVLYLLKQGKVRLYRLSPEGKQFTVALLGDGNIFGKTGTFSTGTHDAYAEAGWVRINTPMTHQEIANMVGATRETVSITLSLLERDGLVRSGRKELSIHAERVGAELSVGGG